MKIKKWTIDPTQSKVGFNVKKLLVTNVRGNFEVFEGGMETKFVKFETLKNIHFKAKVDSIKTDDQKRDEHLKSADFFDTETYPYFNFTAKELNVKDQKIQGELTIRNSTKPVTFDAEFQGISINKNGETEAALTISGKVNRKDFGLSWNGTNAAGEIIVGDEVKLRAQVKFIKENISKKMAPEATA
tara:strand:- start:1114 stop:1674 length:561 start_codon:yes stop_codon:yes gene_type:complete